MAVLHKADVERVLLQADPNPALSFCFKTFSSRKPVSTLLENAPESPIPAGFNHNAVYQSGQSALLGPKEAPPQRSPFRGLQHKQAEAAFTLETAEGQFEGYASVFGIMDLARDVVMPGAFTETLAKRGVGGVRLLWQHDPAVPVGVWEHIAEDRHGLHVRGRLNLETPKAHELAHLMQQGALDGLSIGYRTKAQRRDPQTGLRRLERLDL